MNSVKYSAYGLILFSLMQCAFNIQQEITGEVEVVSRTARAKADREKDPEMFQQLIALHWVTALLPGLCGGAFLMMIRRVDELDPMSTSSPESSAVDELSDYLDQKQKRQDK